MAAPAGHKHAGERRASSVGIWFRSTQGIVVSVVVVLALALGLRLLLRSDSGTTSADAADGAVATPISPGAPTYATEWKTAAGSYRITVTPTTELVPGASASGCIGPAAPGKTNLRFSVRLDNRSAKAVPVPVVSFGANTNASGVVRPSALTYQDSSHAIEIAPLARSSDCTGGFSLGPDGRDDIAAGSGVTYTGLLGGVRTPVTPGLSLVISYPEVSAVGSGSVHQAEVLVPFGTFRTP